MDSKRLVVCGIDPSYSCSGVVAWDGQVVCGSWKLRFPPGPKRLAKAYLLLQQAIKEISPVPTLAVIEDAAYAAPNRVVVGRLKELAGIIKLVLEMADIDVLEVSPTLIKRYIAGSGKAEKHEVSREIKRQYSIAFENDTGYDLSDAAALAVWGWNQRYAPRRKRKR